MRKYAKNKYLEFSAYEGSQHIAGEYALLKILEIIEKFKVTSIAEVGLGIGTIPSTVLGYFKRSLIYVGTENNTFCLESLKNNLDKNTFSTLEIYNDIGTMNERPTKFDLIIIDGKLQGLEILVKRLTKRGIIAIEGDRKDQEGFIRDLFPKSRYVHLISAHKNDARGIFDPKSWQGGIKIFFVRPTVAQSTYWFYNKIRTKMTYFNRKIRS